MTDELWAANQRRHQAELRAHAIQTCQLCDEHGYTPNLVVCDHTDHTPAAARGIAAIRTQMGWTPPDGTQIPKPPQSG